MLEDVVIDALDDIAHGHATLIEVDFISVIDQSLPARAELREFPGHGEIPGDGRDIVTIGRG